MTKLYCCHEILVINKMCLLNDRRVEVFKKCYSFQVGRHARFLFRRNYRAAGFMTFSNHTKEIIFQWQNLISFSLQSAVIHEKTIPRIRNNCSRTSSLNSSKHSWFQTSLLPLRNMTGRCPYKLGIAALLRNNF